MAVRRVRSRDELLPNSDELIQPMTDSQEEMVLVNADWFRVGDKGAIGFRVIQLTTRLLFPTRSGDAVGGYYQNEPPLRHSNMNIRVLFGPH